MSIVIKSVKQSYQLPPEILQMMEIFRQMTNECIRIGLKNDASSMKQLSKLTYNHLANYNITMYYKLCAISHAAGILANRKKSIKRGFQPRQPYAKKPLLISCYGFTVDNGILKIPLGNKQYYHVSLNTYTKKTLSSPSLRIHSFTFAVNTVSICYSTEVTEIKCAKAVGGDRNLRNLTVGNDSEIVHYDLSRAVDIVENTRSIIKSFKRNDVRIRKTLFAKYGRRRKNRISQMLHRVSKAVVQKAVQDKTAISFEKLTFIRRLYQHGNGQGNT